MSSSSKYIPVMVNLVIVVTGLTIIGIGAYGKIQSEPYLDLVRNDRFIFPNMGNLFIYMGVLICVMPFLFSGKVCFFLGLHGGTSSSIEERSITQKLLSFLGLIFGFVFVMMDAFSFRNVVEKNMVSGLEKYGKDGHDGSSRTWDLVQRDFNCCGVVNFTDWSGVGNYSSGQTTDSCCKKVPQVVGCGLNTDAATKNKGGCLKEFDDQLLTYIDVMVLVVLGIGFILAIGVFCIRKLARGVASEHPCFAPI